MKDTNGNSNTRSWADMAEKQDSDSEENNSAREKGAEEVHQGDNEKEQEGENEESEEPLLGSEAEGAAIVSDHQQNLNAESPIRNLSEQLSRVVETPQSVEANFNGQVQENIVMGENEGFELSKSQKKRLKEKERKERRALEATKTPPNTRSRGNQKSH